MNSKLSSPDQKPASFRGKKTLKIETNVLPFRAEASDPQCSWIVWGSQSRLLGCWDI